MIHGTWCNAKTYRTQCRFCVQPAFFFSCDCGSRVFFEDLGQPWTKHACSGYARAQEEIAARNHRIAELDLQIAELEIELRRRIEAAAKARRQVPIECVLPRFGAAIGDVGVVRELEEKVDLYKKAKLPHDAPLGKYFLGPLAKGTFFQVTIHTGDVVSEQLKSFTFFVEATIWRNIRSARGDLLRFALVGERLANGFDYWRCTELRWPL